MLAPVAGIFVVVALLLSACSTTSKIPVTPKTQKDWVQYQLEAGRINSWDLHGRAAIFVDDEVHNIGLNWRHNQDEFLMVLEAPFGQGVFRLESSRETDLPVKLSLPDGKAIYAETAEAALQSIVGWSIPVSGLESWIKGVPQKSTDYRHALNGDGRLKSLWQNGWRINYLEYFKFKGAEKGLPKKMYLKHGRLALKIVIEHWQKPELTTGNAELFPDFN